MLEHHIRQYLFPDMKLRDSQYPVSFDVLIEVVDDSTNVPIPGARVYVDNEWCSTTWKDGSITFPLESRTESDEAYDVVLKAVGYLDSATQTISESGTLVFRLISE
jgi:hypothetical protein